MTDITNINFDSFSHGQIKSKLWLCEKLEPYIPKFCDIAILGSWYNILGFMLLVRNSCQFNSITGIDIDPTATTIANKICDYWSIELPKVKSICANANDVSLNEYNVIINCSSEHMHNTNWFNNIPEKSLVCIQSSNVIDPEHPWYITLPSTSIENFSSKYDVSSVLYLGTLPIVYDTWGYERYMLIGIK